MIDFFIVSDVDSPKLRDRLQMNFYQGMINHMAKWYLQYYIYDII